ncbi:MAG TPA: glycosyltransferase family 4 protein [Nitrososphaeraceae archaeon]
MHSPNPFPGASWVRTEFFAQYFKNKGNTVAISGSFSLKTLGKAGSRTLDGLKILNITPIIMAPNLLSLVFNITSSFIFSTVSLILLRPKIVIISVPNGETGLGSYIATRLLRIRKVVIDYRDEWEDHVINRISPGIYKKSYLYLKRTMTKCYTKSNLVVATTQPLAQKLISRGIKDVKVIANGADVNVFKPYDKQKSRAEIGIDKKDFVLVYSGGIGAYYRLDIVIKAMQKASIKIHNLRLLMVGRGHTIQEILDLAKEIGLAGNVQYLGAKMNRDELAKIFSASDIGLIPYDSNPLWKNSIPVKALEYLACGLPIIATVYEDSVLAKLINENEVGLVALPESVDSLAFALEKIYEVYFSASETKKNEVDKIDNSFEMEVSKRAILLIKTNFDRNELTRHFSALLENRF